METERRTHVRRLVLDVLKPHQPRIDILALKLSELEGIDSVNIIRTETDRNTEGIIVTIVGDDIKFDTVEETLRINGCSIHSVDEVVAGEHIIKTVRLPKEEDTLDAING